MKGQWLENCFLKKCAVDRNNHTEPEQPWCLSFNFRAFITLFSVFLPTSCHALIMPVTSCKCSLLLIFHSWQRSVCSSTELVFACVAPDVNALTNFHPGREALYVFKDVYIILSVLQWKWHLRDELSWAVGGAQCFSLMNDVQLFLITVFLVCLSGQ